MRLRFPKNASRHNQDFYSGIPPSAYTGQQDDYIGNAGNANREPYIRVDEGEEGVRVRAEVPGFTPADLAIELQNDRELILRGQKETQPRDPYFDRRFSTRVNLPSPVHAEKADVKLEHGILTVTLPKIPGNGRKRVNIRS